MASIIKTKFVECCTVNEAMVFYRGNQSQAAKDMSINRGTLRRWLDDGDKLVMVIRHADGATISHFERFK